MSTSLKWQPVAAGQSFPGDYDVQLKEVIRRRSGHDGKCHLTIDDRGFVEGLVAADVDGATAILELLDKYGSIELWEES